MSAASARIPLDRRGQLCCAGLVLAALLPHLGRLHPALLATLAALFLGPAGPRSSPGGGGSPPGSGCCCCFALLGLIVLLHGGGAPREGGVALLAAMLVLKLYESAQVRDGRTLAGFVLFTLLGALLFDGSLPLTLYAAAVSLATFLALRDFSALLADGRREQPEALPSALLAVLASAAAALPFAVLLFLLFPRLPAPLWGAPLADAGRTGLGDSMSPGDLRELLIDDRTALRLELLSGEMPGEQDRYLRGPVLWDYDGQRWTRPRGLLAFGDPEGLPPTGEEIRYRLSLEPSDRPWVPALDAPVAAAEGLHLDRDRTLRSRNPLDRPLSLELRSLRTGGALLGPPRAGERRRALALPEGFDPRARALAASWWREAGGDPRRYIDRILAWFGAEFRYELASPPLGRHRIDEFLFATRSGYCEHFASAFAVLMRAAGIPSRVVTGFHGGYRNPLGGHWVFRYADAHAWVEVLLGDAWIRIDPTAAVAPERRAAGLLEAGLGLERGGGLWFGWRALGEWIAFRWQRLVLDFDQLRQQRLLVPFGIEHTTWRELGLLLAALFALGALLGLWLVAHGERARRADPALLAWALLDRKLARLGLARGAAEGPHDWIERAARARPADAAALRRLGAAFIAQRYGGGIADGRELLAAVRRWRPRS
ncbi:MAG: DUF3488 and transglutaminase-like domain-containing protein [Xanthomonadales bacterium]|nr:DUF3488 and transglutaminase-like domain-containing protein [Xanthomonadales bacterium]